MNQSTSRDIPCRSQFRVSCAWTLWKTLFVVSLQLQRWSSVQVVICSWHRELDWPLEVQTGNKSEGKPSAENKVWAPRLEVYGVLPRLCSESVSMWTLKVKGFIALHLNTEQMRKKWPAIIDEDKQAVILDVDTSVLYDSGVRSRVFL